MKIKVPTYVLEHELTDHEKLFCGVMTFFASTEGWVKARYYMYSNDVKHILGHTRPHKKFPRLSAEEYKSNEYGSQLNNIEKLFRIGFFTTQRWGIEFIDPGFQYKAANGQLLQSEIEITDIEVIKLYYYIMGRMSGTESIINKGISIESEADVSTRALHRFFEDHAMI
tara:strand:- start:1338 stop:1844 length:507 start_codon:yes stop_codon:yes gene_type:complete